MKILVTAFGPFGGRSENASSLALAGLRLVCPHVHTRVLPVDSLIAPELMQEALLEIQPDALIMLGEAAGSKKIRLETTAWNELDFHIPDIAGRQPSSQLIDPAAPISLASTLPLEKFYMRLINNDHAVCFSDNAGRYLCNQLFFTVRHFLESSASSCSAGFVHLPLAHEYPTERAVAALEEMIGAL